MGASVQELKHAARLRERSVKAAERRNGGNSIKSLVRRAPNFTENVLQFGSL